MIGGVVEEDVHPVPRDPEVLLHDGIDGGSVDLVLLGAYLSNAHEEGARTRSI